MRRTHLYRGKAKIDPKEWLLGSLIVNDKGWWIETQTPDNNHESGLCIEVEPETVGQFMNAYDAKEAMIFEDDIIIITPKISNNNGIKLVEEDIEELEEEEGIDDDEIPSAAYLVRCLRGERFLVGCDFYEDEPFRNVLSGFNMDVVDFVVVGNAHDGLDSSFIANYQIAFNKINELYPPITNGAKRDVLYRGRSDDNQWAIGYLIVNDHGTWIEHRNDFVVTRLKVDPSTVGEFVGLYTFTNHQPIFEDDFVKFNNDLHLMRYSPGMNVIYGAFPDDSFCEFAKHAEDVGYMYQPFHESDSLECIGNIFDNPSIKILKRNTEAHIIMEQDMFFLQLKLVRFKECLSSEDLSYLRQINFNKTIADIIGCAESDVQKMMDQETLFYFSCKQVINESHLQLLSSDSATDHYAIYLTRTNIHDKWAINLDTGKKLTVAEQEHLETTIIKDLFR